MSSIFNSPLLRCHRPNPYGGILNWEAEYTLEDA